MKKFNLSLVAVLAMSTFAIAGGDIAPVEPVVEEVMVEEVSDAGFYLGLGYGWTGLELDDTRVGGTDTSADMGSIMIDAGYKFNSYIAVEGRYWFGLGSSNDLGWTSGISGDLEIDSWGVYVKPMYPVTDAFDIYALLGYGGTSMTDTSFAGLTVDSDGFSWGLGVSYEFTENISMFVDYVSIITNDGVEFGGLALPFEASVDTVNIGVNYKF